MGFLARCGLKYRQRPRALKETQGTRFFLQPHKPRAASLAAVLLLTVVLAGMSEPSELDDRPTSDEGHRRRRPMSRFQSPAR